MVCSRCKMVVKSQFERIGIQTISVELGEVEIAHTPSPIQMTELNTALKALGFEMIDDKKGQTIEKIKNLIITLVHHSNDEFSTNLSTYISTKLLQDYNYLSNLFSEVEGTTIEKYFIAQKIEKVKELLVYNEMTLSEIADRLGYSSVAYLSNQFKKVTGLTPSFFRKMKHQRLIALENL